jgi:ankyrin repeat protein
MFAFVSRFISNIYLFFGADVNNPKSGYLSSAYYHNDVSFAKKLIEKKGADINLIDNKGYTPLYFAMQYCPEGARDLLSRSVELLDYRLPNTKETYLHFSIRNHKDELTNLILEKTGKTLVNVRDVEGRSATYVAIEEGYTELADKFIFDYGNVIHNPTEGVELLVNKVKQGNSTVTEYLINNLGVDVNSLDASGTPVICYATNGNVMKVLIDLGAEFNFTLPDGRTLLHHTILKGSESAVLTLLKNGANPLTLDKDGLSPLYHVFAKGYANAAKEILSKTNYYLGNDILFGNLLSEMIDDNKVEALKFLLKVAPAKIHDRVDGMPSILAALKAGQIEVAKVLKSYGAFVSGNDRETADVLHDAILDNKEAVVKYMIKELGTSPNTLDSKGMSALDVIKSCLPWMLNPSIALLGKGYKNINSNIVQHLIDAGIDTTKLDNYNKSYLYKAIEKRDLAAVKLLLAVGDNPNAIHNNCLKNPVFLACEKNDYSIISELIKAKAFVSAVDPSTGLAPIQVAITNNEESIVKALVDANADLRVIKNDGANVVHLAVKHMDSYMVSFIAKKIPTALYMKDIYGDTPLDLAEKTSILKANEIKAIMGISTTPQPATSTEYKTAYYDNKHPNHADDADLAGPLYPDLHTPTPSAPPLD